MVNDRWALYLRYTYTVKKPTIEVSITDTVVSSHQPYLDLEKVLICCQSVLNNSIGSIEMDTIDGCKKIGIMNTIMQEGCLP
jgi:hypothetical protein